MNLHQNNANFVFHSKNREYIEKPEINSCYMLSKRMPSISMADADLQESDSFHLVGLMFSAYMKLKDEIESSIRSAAQ